MRALGGEATSGGGGAVCASFGEPAALGELVDAPLLTLAVVVVVVVTAAVPVVVVVVVAAIAFA